MVKLTHPFCELNLKFNLLNNKLLATEGLIKTRRIKHTISKYAPLLTHRAI